MDYVQHHRGFYAHSENVPRYSELRSRSGSPRANDLLNDPVRVYGNEMAEIGDLRPSVAEAEISARHLVGEN